MMKINDSRPVCIAAFNEALYCVANTESDGRRLWASDGTDAGTVMVEDASKTAIAQNPGYLTVIDGNLFFSATGTNVDTSATSGGEL